MDPRFPTDLSFSFSYLAFLSVGIERTWWRLFQKRIECSKFNIYVFITLFCFSCSVLYIFVPFSFDLSVFFYVWLLINHFFNLGISFYLEPKQFGDFGSVIRWTWYFGCFANMILSFTWFKKVYDRCVITSEVKCWVAKHSRSSECITETFEILILPVSSIRVLSFLTLRKER